MSILKEIVKNINEMNLDKLPKINYNWNPNKEENNKMLIQLNKRLKYPHFENKIVGILNNGIKNGLEKGLKLKNKKDDLCIRFIYSNFVLVYNRKDDYIRGIRTDINVNCDSNVGVYETYKDKKRTQEDLMIDAFIEGEIVLGLKLETEGFNLKITNVCECVEVEY